MRTRIQSCALLSIMAILLAACEGGASRNSSTSIPPKSQLVERTEFSSPDDAMKLADSLKYAGADADALSVLTAAYQRFPENVKLLSAYGRQALAMGQDELAGRLLRRALDADPDDWRALSAMAVLKERAGRIDEARIALKRARTLSGDDTSVLNNLGTSYLLAGDADEAATLFRKALTAPDLNARYTAQLKRNLAVALAVKGEFDLADRLAGKRMPRRLMNAPGKDITIFMGIAVRPAPAPSGWTARLADASAALADPMR